MKKTNLSHMDVEVFEETLENGLRIFVLPISKSNGVYATYTTKYGSMIREFIPKDQTEFVTVPDGIAHFLEHKLFEQKDGEDPFTFFGKTGSDCNANTSNYKTTYLFSGSNDVKENLTYLLDFVSEPYFTDENVEKEKGIIEQEIDANADDPDWVGVDGILRNAFQLNPIRIPIPGTVESIKKITKEDLYTCYETFYEPSNMFVVVSGKVDPERVIATVKKQQEKQNKKKQPLPILQTYEEPDAVGKKKEVISLNVTIPKLLFAYKFNIASTGVSRTLAYNYISLLANLKFGSVSLFAEQLKEERLITYPIDYDLVYTDRHILLTLFAETKNPDLLIKRIEEEMRLDDIEEADFNRKRKTILSACIYMSDDIYRMNHKIINDLLLEDQVNYQVFEMFQNLNFETFTSVRNRLCYDHTTAFIIEPNNQ